jgi:predicted RNA-binding Zn ribbon-like protein
MTKNERPIPFLIADDRALDFLNSIASPRGKEIEWVVDGNDLLAWLEHTALVPTSVLKQFRKKVMDKELNSIAAKARELREWFRGFVDNNAGQPLKSKAVDELTVINRLLKRDNCYRQIEAWNLPIQENDKKYAALRWRQERRWQSPQDLLLPIVEVIGDSICNVDFAFVKKCENPPCSLWFHDVSQNHTRRWCSMAVCGNRAKAAAHRAKKRSANSEPKKLN